MSIGGAAVALAVLALASCASRQAPGAAEQPAPFPAARFAVLSDPHVYDTSLSEPGPAFDRHLRKGEKLLAESGQILETALTAISEEKPAFLLVCGDLTKDGERASHLLAARLLTAVAEAGTPVFVVPGNHDILNPTAFRYVENRVERVDSVTPGEFAEIYGRFGYDTALMRDPDSLSYVAEPVPGLWLLALDSCRYNENRLSIVSGGMLSAETRAWAAGVLGEARARGMRVIAFLHHGIMEHFRGQKSWMPNDVIDDYDAVAGLLAAGGVEVAFTGHGHSQDSTRRTFPRWGRSDVIYDVETGATVSYPDPWRLVEVDPAGGMKIESRFVTSIPEHPVDFPGYAMERLREGAIEMASVELRHALVSERSAGILAAQIADVATVYFRGDERVVRRGFDLSGLGPWAVFIAEALSQPLRDVQTDLPPADNDVTLQLRR